MSPDKRKLLQLDILDVADAFCERANVHVEDDNLKAATDDYIMAIHLNENHAIAYNNLAYIWMIRDELPAALENINKAIALQDDPVFYNTRGLIYHEMGDMKKSLEDYKTAITIDPNYDHAWHGIYTVRDDIRAEINHMLTSHDIKTIDLPDKLTKRELR